VYAYKTDAVETDEFVEERRKAPEEGGIKLLQSFE